MAMLLEDGGNMGRRAAFSKGIPVHARSFSLCD